MSTVVWWDTFLDQEGRDSEEEAAFVGYLYQHGVPAASPPDQLQSAYGEFRTFMEESEARASADPGPDAATQAADQARVRIQQRTIPKSRIAAPGVDKPLTAVTRPKETRQPLTEAPPGPEGQANVAPETAPGGGVERTPPAQETPSQGEARYGRRRGESSESA